MIQNGQQPGPSDAGAPIGVRNPVQTVLVTASDTQSGAGMQMRLSNRADFAGAVWKAYTSTVTWDFSGGGTVFVQVRDGAGISPRSAPRASRVPRRRGTSPTPSCNPRPRSRSISRRVTGRWLRRLLATTGANNGLRAVRFDSFATALVDVGDQTSQAAPFAVSIPAGQEPTSLQFTVRRAPGASAATVRLVVIDGCGELSTFVGGGPGAW